MSEKLGWSEIDYGNITAAFSFAYAFGYLFGGRIMDRLGVKRGLPIFVIVWSAAAMAHVLDTLARPRVVAIIDPENDPSKRVAARLGMQYEARYTGAQLGHRKPEIVVDLFFRGRGPRTC